MPISLHNINKHSTTVPDGDQI